MTSQKYITKTTEKRSNYSLVFKSKTNLFENVIECTKLKNVILKFK